MIRDLPEEILAEIFSFLHSKFNILINSLVCKKWFTATRLTPLRLQIISSDQFTRFLNITSHFHDDNFISVSKLLVNHCLVNENEIGKLCSLLNVSALESLELRGNEFSLSGLQLIIDRFPKLKSLDIRDIRSACDYLLGSANRLPNLTELKANFDFDRSVQVKEHSIKPQIRSLTLCSYQYLTYYTLTKLEFPNLTALDLDGRITIDSNVLPLGLKKLSIKLGFIDMQGMEKVSETLEYFSLENSEISGFEVFENLEFNKLKSLTLKSMSKEFWGKIDSSNHLRPLNLTSLNVQYNLNASKLLRKFCNLDTLTCLNISNCNIDMKSFGEFMKECEWKNLTELDISVNPLTSETIPILEAITSLKVLKAKDGTLNNSDRGILCALGSSRSIEVNCFATRNIEPEKDEKNMLSCTSYVNSLQNYSTSTQSVPKHEHSVCSFDFDKNLKIFIKGIEKLSDFYTEFEPHHTLSFFIECRISSAEKKEQQCTKFIPHSSSGLEWNEEITFHSVKISDLSCEAKIELALFFSVLNPITGIRNRKYIASVECPIFDSNLELQQGDVKLIETKNSIFSMDVSFDIYNYSIKYEIDKIPPLRFKEAFQIYEEHDSSLIEWKQRDNNIGNPEKYVPFLKSIPFEYPWAIYLARQYVNKWEKPEHVTKILAILSESVSNSIFIKQIFVEILKDMPEDTFITFLPFLCTHLQCDCINGVMTQYMLKRAISSKVIGNQFFWLLKVESHNHPIYNYILSEFLSRIEKETKKIIENQCLFLDSIEDLKYGRKDQKIIWRQPLFIPFYDLSDEVKSLKLQNVKSNVDICFVSGKVAELSFCRSDHKFDFIINSFLQTHTFLISDFPSFVYSKPRITNIPTGFEKGFALVLDRPSFTLIKCRSMTKLDPFLSSQSEIVKDNFLLTSALDAFIGHIFESTGPSELLIDTEGHLKRSNYNAKSFMSTRVLGLVIRLERMIYDELAEYLRDNKLFNQFKVLIDKLSSIFLENLDLIEAYLKAFNYKKRNLIEGLENRLRNLERYNYQ